jgi:hypothetical protein
VDDGFQVGVVFPPGAPDEWFVAEQVPAAGEQREEGDEVNFTTQETPPEGC